MSRSWSRAALVAAAVGAPAGAANAYELQKTASGVPVRWVEPEIVFHVELDDRDAQLPKDSAVHAARAALRTWSDAGGPVLIEADNKDKPGDDDNVIRFATDIDDEEIDPAALALTHLRYDPETGAIKGVRIAVNAAAFGWVVDKKCDHDEYDLESTLAHEIGHALGLRHSTSPDATMFTRPAPCERDRRDLTQDDLDGIDALYHDDVAVGGPVVDGDEGAGMGGCSAGGSRSAPSGGVALLLLLAAAGLWRYRRPER